MPLEIRELVIKATVDSSNGGNPSQASKKNNEVVRQEKLVDRCVEKVLEILKEKSER